MTILQKLLPILIVSLILFLTSCTTDDDTNLPITNYTTVEKVLTEINFQGYAIVTKNGNDLVRQGFGMANQHTAMPQDYELAYRIGSVSKTLTAAAMAQLKRDGLISSFNETLNEFDTEFPQGDQITIAHLLSHQSGLPEYQLIAEQAFAEGNELDETEIYEVITDLISQNGLNFIPGTKKEYCNSNYLISALIIEQLTGMNFHQYIQQKIFNPLQMTHSYKGTDVIDTDIHAQGYLNGVANSTYPIAIPFGVGDFSSTPKDMEIWIDAVKTNWFSEVEKAEIFVQNVPSGFVDFGLGWFTSQEGDTTMYWHGGDINGYWSMIGFIPKYDATIVVLSNQQDDSGLQRNTLIQQILRNEFN